MVDLNALWKAGQCPLCNGVLFPDGSYFPVFVQGDYPLLPDELSIVRIEPARWDEASKEWTTLRPLGVLREEAGWLHYGGGVSDDAGFVARLDESENLLWLAYFNGVCPFVTVEGAGAAFMARNANVWRWHFPVVEPQKFWIEAPGKDLNVWG